MVKAKYVLAPQPTMKRVADLDGPDFYRTPRWATIALLENEGFVGSIWECACGDGEMSKVLLERGFEVYSSDLYDRGFGYSGVDFVTADRIEDNIITNPPFHSAEEFVRAGLAKSRKKFALLLRLAFLEGANRQREIFSKNPPSRVWIFSERITLYPAGAEVKGTGTMAYAWFVWDKDSNPLASELKWIPLGYRSSDDGQAVLPLA